jgi:hypothetical protein
MNYDPYPIRFRPDERQMLKEIACRFERTQQETVRSLVRVAYEYFKEQDGQTTKEKTQEQ